MNAEQKKRVVELIAALRSGKYEQGHDQLRNGNAFCCLGVACDLYNKDLWKRDHFLDHLGSLPNEVLFWYGFPHRLGPTISGTNLAGWNDSGFSFDRIAAELSNWLDEQPSGESTP